MVVVVERSEYRDRVGQWARGSRAMTGRNGRSWRGNRGRTRAANGEMVDSNSVGC